MPNEEKEWLELARKGPDIWNSVVRRRIGESGWNDIIRSLPDNYPPHQRDKLNNIKPLSDAENKTICGEVGLLYFESFGNTNILFENSIFNENISFSGFVMPDTIFNGVTFRENAAFDFSVFLGMVKLYQCEFSETASFTNSVFQDEFLLSGVKFKKNAIFTNATFKSFRIVGVDYSDQDECNDGVLIFNGSVSFEFACFQSEVSFQFVKFNGVSSFNKAIFVKEASFNKARFVKEASFRNVIFEEDVEFNGAKFKGKAFFHASAFNGSARFKEAEFKKVTFIGSEFKLFVNFIEAEFELSPHFENVECGAIYLDGATFKNDLQEDSLQEAASAWAALIRLMEKIHNMPQRAIFHAKLLEVEKHYKSERSAKFLYEIYEMLGSGRSALLPFIWLLLCSVLSFPVYWFITSNMLSALVYSWGNTIPFIPTHKPFTKDIWNGLSSVEAQVYLTCASSVHALISILLIALIGLALRNRFRVK